MLPNEELLMVLRRQINFDTNQKNGRDRLFGHVCLKMCWSENHIRIFLGPNVKGGATDGHTQHTAFHSQQTAVTFTFYVTHHTRGSRGITVARNQNA